MTKRIRAAASASAADGLAPRQRLTAAEDGAALRRALRDAEAALRASEERYALAMRAINEGVYEWDVASGEMYYSPRVCELVGFEPGELKTMADWTDRIHPDDQGRFRQAIISHFKGDAEWLECEYRYRHDDRSWHWVRHHGIALRDKDGRATRVVGSVGDITTRKETEQALRESLEQQTATAEVLQVINASPGDLAPVFEAMLDKAMRLCGAAFGIMTNYDGETFRTAAHRGLPPRFAEFADTMGQRWAGAHTRLAAGADVVHLLDVKDDPAYRTLPSRRALVDLGGARTVLLVALRKDGALLGSFAIYRQEVRAFSDREISVVQSFADHAVIAMENARLLTETREALEQQTATAEVLGVINASPGDLAPVFDAMLEKATRLCEAETAHLLRYENGDFSRAASLGVPEDFDKILPLGQPIRVMTSASGPMRMLASREIVHMHDVREDESYRTGAPAEVSAAEAGIRTALFVPLLKEEAVVGCFVMHRMEVRPFSDKQIALLQNFAAQAVIAIENARLLTETREALERQTATAEILRVISSSPTDVQPTFEAIAAAAKSLTGAVLGGVLTYDGERLEIVAASGWTPQEFAKARSVFPIPADRGTTSGRAIVTRAVAHIEDVATDPEFAYAPLADMGGHTSLAVPMLRDGEPIGAIVVQRRQVERFADAQIDLLKTFAAQAVIAIENVRLFNELNERTGDLQESLEYQTATSDVLKVISRSTFDLQPVLNTLVETAARLLDAGFTFIASRDGERYRPTAFYAVSPEWAARLPTQSFAADRGTVLGRALLEARPVQVEDVAADPEHAHPEAVTLGKARTVLGVPLLREGQAIGVLVLARRHVEPFNERQIELVRTFADQAVIAIENTRLLTETREALEQQTATAEVLQVINSSPGDLAPVFDSILAKATRLCEAEFGVFWSYDGAQMRAAALQNAPAVFAAFAEEAFAPMSDGPMARLIAGDAVSQVLDAANSQPKRAAVSPLRRAFLELGGPRTVLFVALRKDTALLGALMLYRPVVRGFSEKQIALVTSFADQAVIAIENARLITETREALEQQTATAEVLQVINSSPGNLAPVFDAMLEKAARLCEGTQGVLWTYDGERFRPAAMFGVSAEFVVEMERAGRPGPLTPMGRIAGGERLVQIVDLAADESYRAGEPVPRVAVEIGGFRSLAAVALVKDEALLGAFIVSRREMRPFTDKQIALLQNFAAQAVIAMENARLITETREALERQTATAEVLQVINASAGDLAPVFDAMLDKAIRLCAASYGHFRTFDGEGFPLAAVSGEPELRELHQHRFGYFRPGPHNPISRLLGGESMVHFADAGASEAYREDPNFHDFVDTGCRSMLAVALRKDATLLGYISVYRGEVRAFSDKEIALLQNFAAQAVSAMENARLLGELRERTADLEESLEYQTATSDVLKVISRSTFDLQPVLDTVAATAARLCEADLTLITARDGEVYRTVATFAASPQYDAALRKQAFTIDRGTVTGRVALDRAIVHIADIAADPDYVHRESVTVGKIRTTLGVPLLREGVVVGTINLGRARMQPYTERQIELVRTFADQAVIAIENARLITETREALEQQTATAEILQVINASPGDLQPVFDAMLDKAMHLCGAAFGELRTYDGETLRIAAMRGVPAPLAEYRTRTRNLPASGMAARILAGERVINVVDLMEEDAYRRGEPNRRAMVDLGGARSALAVALRTDSALLGRIMIYRQEVRAFSDKEVSLLQNFAAQAVIAMENARLLGELRERTRDLEESLEYQTATSDVLKVISRSTFDLQPVLDTLIQTAAQLCTADGGAITIREDEAFRFVAVHGVSGEASTAIRGRLLTEEGARPLQDEILQGRTTHIADILDTEYRQSKSVTLGKLRTILIVPMLRDGTAIGALHFHRLHVEPFSERQIELVRTFADQAVIAIENTRLLEELRESLEQQQAIAEILQVINRSPGELRPVFDAILEKAMALCDVAYGDLELYDGKSFRAVATRGLTDTFDAQVRRGYPGDDNPATRPLIAGERVSHIANMADVDFSKVFAHEPVKDEGHHTLLCVPLRRDDALLGMIACARGEVRAFSEKEIALLENFAAQAVIAMDNARLLDEIRRRQTELRVTFDNMGDGVAMFDADMRLTAWNMNFQKILDLPDAFVATRPSLQEYFQFMAARGEYVSPQLEAEIGRNIAIADHQSRFERTRPDGRVIEVRRNVVPGGGSVLIFSDITERKRAEAEIGRARDAAETALSELKAAQANLIQAEKMASLGQLTAGIAHEIKNPLNFVNNFAGLSVELLDELKETAAPAWETLEEETRAEIDETIDLLTGNLGKIAEHGRRADNIVKSMLEHSRGASGERRPVELNALVEEALNLAYHGARAQDQNFNITLERHFGEGIAPIELAPQDVMRVFLNLFGNGFYAANKRQQQEAGAAFKPTLKVTTRDLGDAVEVLVRDNGTGIPAAVRDKLFQPFFTTKPTGEGTGLGLSISYDIVTQQHGGTIAVDSRPGEFTEFTVRLPRTAATTAR